MSYLSQAISYISTISRLQPWSPGSSVLLKLTAKEGTVLPSNPGLSSKMDATKSLVCLGLGQFSSVLWFETMESKMTSGTLLNLTTLKLTLPCDKRQ